MLDTVGLQPYSRERCVETGRLCGVADGLENALAASFCIKKIM